MTLEYKHNIKFDVKNFENKEVDGMPVFYFEGYASTSGVIDLGDDIVAKGATVDGLLVEIPKLCLMHDSMCSLPLGIIQEAFEDDRGLFIKAAMPLADTLVSGRVVPQLKIKSVDSLSIGYRTIESHDTVIEGRTVRVLTKIIVKEVSIVTFPMNTEARITSLKSYLSKLENKTDEREDDKENKEEKTVTPWGSLPKELAGRERRWDSTAATKRWRDASDSNESPSKKYKNNFLWYDRAESDNFGAYKLPVGDIIDDSRKAIPRAIFAARAALAGARGGVDIPESDREGVKANINKYYEAMDLEPPFSKGKAATWTIEEIKSLGKSDLNYVIRNEDISRKSADHIASLVISAQEMEETHAGEEDKGYIDSINEFKNEIQKMKGDFKNEGRN